MSASEAAAPTAWTCGSASARGVVDDRRHALALARDVVDRALGSSVGQLVVAPAEVHVAPVAPAASRRARAMGSSSASASASRRWPARGASFRRLIRRVTAPPSSRRARTSEPRNRYGTSANGISEMTNGHIGGVAVGARRLQHELSDQRDHQRHARRVHRRVEPPLGARGGAATGGSGCGARATISTTPIRLIAMLATSTTESDVLDQEHVVRAVRSTRTTGRRTGRAAGSRPSRAGRRRSRCGGRRVDSRAVRSREQRVHRRDDVERAEESPDGEDSRDVRRAQAGEQDQAKPVAAISEPRLLSGRRAHANSPVPMKPQPITSPSTATAPRRFVWLLVRTSRDVDHAESEARAGQAPEGPLERSSEQCLQRSAGELSLWDEAAHVATVSHRAEVRKVSARGEDDRRGRAVRPSDERPPRSRRCPGAARRAGPRRASAPRPRAARTCRPRPRRSPSSPRPRAACARSPGRTGDRRR